MGISQARAGTPPRSACSHSRLSDDSARFIARIRGTLITICRTVIAAWRAGARCGVGSPVTPRLLSGYEREPCRTGMHDTCLRRSSRPGSPDATTFPPTRTEAGLELRRIVIVVVERQTAVPSTRRSRDQAARRATRVESPEAARFDLQRRPSRRAAARRRIALAGRRARSQSTPPATDASRPAPLLRSALRPARPRRRDASPLRAGDHRSGPATRRHEHSVQSEASGPR